MAEPLSYGSVHLRGRVHRLIRAATHVVPLALLAFIALEWNGIPGQPRDTLAYHQAAASAADGAIYDPVPPIGPHEDAGVWYYLYPPPLAALLAALPRVDYQTFDRGWLLLNVLAFWLFAACLEHLSRGTWTWGGTARWGAALFFMPGTLLVIHFGNIDLIILALVALGLAMPALGGASVGFAAAFKVTPAWPLLALVVRRPRQTIPGVMLAAAICGGACLFTFGMRGTGTLLAQWMADILPALGQGQFWGGSLTALNSGNLGMADYTANLSLSFLPVQLAVYWGWWEYQGGLLPTSLRVYLTGFSVAAPLLAFWMTRHRTVNVQAAIVLAAAMLSAPIVRPYVIPVLLLVAAAHRQERRMRLADPSSGAVEHRPPEYVIPAHS